MTYDDIAPFLWFGFSAGFLVGWFALAGINATEKALIRYLRRRAVNGSSAL